MVLVWFVCGLRYFVVVLVLEGVHCGFFVLGLFAMGSLLFGFRCVLLWLVYVFVVYLRFVLGF